MNKAIKEIMVTYTVKLATYDPESFVNEKEKLYELFDDAFFKDAETILGVSFLVDNTQLSISGKETVSI